MIPTSTPNSSLNTPCTPGAWKVGDIILGTYEVKYIHASGGMGLVYRVFHCGWNIDLAVKSPKASLFQTEKQKQNFIAECETWIDLGLHPHITSCYYVENIDGAPCIFAEYIEGGSLYDWIRQKNLYRDSPPKRLRRILDIAIQMAWGLNFAHENGVIHQDVKPANVLMTNDGNARITDFGIAKTSSAARVSTSFYGRQSMVVSSGYATPAYCSPEQAQGLTITRRTDIWSWAVTVLEMLLGDIYWKIGANAGLALENLDALIDKNILKCPVPHGLIALLRECLQPVQESRPHDFTIISKRLIEIYRAEFQIPFPRVLPQKIDTDADTLNNRIISLVGLGRVFTDKRHDAYSLLINLRSQWPLHLNGRLNELLIQWKKLGMPIAELNRHLDNILKDGVPTEKLAWFMRLELEKCDTRRAAGVQQLSNLPELQIWQQKITQLRVDIKQKLHSFFQEDKQRQPPPLYGALSNGEGSQSTGMGDQHYIAFSGSNRGIAAICEDRSEVIKITDLRQNMVLKTVTSPHRTQKMALSENGTYLGIVDVSFNINNERDRDYRISVCHTDAADTWITLVGKLPREAQIRALTIDDQCLCATLWLWYHGCLFEQIHSLHSGNLKVSMCDFRHPSKITDFEQIYINGERTLLITVSGNSNCSLWRYPDANNDDGINMLDIDLADFGLVDIDEMLPGLTLEHGFEYRLDCWNAHSFMRVINECCSKYRAEYLISTPSDTRKLYKKNQQKDILLDLASCAEEEGDLSSALQHLNDFCGIEVTPPTDLFLRRHKIATSLPGAHVTRCYHLSSKNWYWESTVFGISPAAGNHVTLNWPSGLGIYKLPYMKIVEKTKWLDADRNESFSMDWNTGKVLHQVQCTQDVAWLKVVKSSNNEPALFVAFEKKGCAIFNRALQPIDDSRIIHPLVQQLSPVTAVADDLSALLGWSDNNHLTHISLHDMRETQIWCFGDSKYMQSHVGSKACQYSIYDRPKHVILSACGRVAAYMLLHDVILIDALTGKVVLQWRTPWGKINGLSFDGSGQWMILVHNDNQIEIFHLWWDVA